MIRLQVTRKYDGGFDAGIYHGDERTGVATVVVGTSADCTAEVVEHLVRLVTADTYARRPVDTVRRLQPGDKVSAAIGDTFYVSVVPDDSEGGVESPLVTAANELRDKIVKAINKTPGRRHVNHPVDPGRHVVEFTDAGGWTVLHGGGCPASCDVSDRVDADLLHRNEMPRPPGRYAVAIVGGRLLIEREPLP